MRAAPEQTVDAPETVGLVAGRGDFPLLIAQAVQKQPGRELTVVAVNGDASPEIVQYAKHVDWLYAGQLRKTIAALRQQKAKTVVFAGQIKPSRLFKGLRPDLKALKLLWRLHERNAETLFSTVADEFEKAGIHVLPSTAFMEESLAGEGLLAGPTPGKTLQRDIDYGWKIAREVSRLDIGQTVVVKKGTILAVEGFEGTDKAIRRGGELGYGGVTVIKVAKPNHDMRFDVPCIGMRTVQSLVEAGARALAVQAGKTLLLRRDDVLEACRQNRISVAGIGAAEN